MLTSSSSALDNSVLSLGVTPEHSFIESCARLSVSLEGPGLFALTSSPIPLSANDERADVLDDYDDDDDENVVADDEDDDDPELFDDDDFAAELDLGISNDDDIENNPKHSLHNKCIRYNTSRSPPKGGSSEDGGSISVVGSCVGGGAISHDDDDDEVTVVKRRYRQNKKKLTTQTTRSTAQHQRRLRSGASKSLDHAQMSSENVSPPPPPLGPKPTLAIAANASTSCSAGNGSGSGGAGGTSAVTTRISAKTRTCSRCNRGIRHSSSCSSASGGGNGGGGGSHMTMDELRAVNRYAESTKSLSYLPQVRDEFLLASRISV